MGIQPAPPNMSRANAPALATIKRGIFKLVSVIAWGLSVRFLMANADAQARIKQLTPAELTRFVFAHSPTLPVAKAHGQNKMPANVAVSERGASLPLVQTRSFANAPRALSMRTNGVCVKTTAVAFKSKILTPALVHAAAVLSPLLATRRPASARADKPSLVVTVFASQQILHASVAKHKTQIPADANVRMRALVRTDLPLLQRPANAPVTIQAE